MKLLFLLLAALLIGKDTLQINDPYLMRGVAQFLALMAGAGMLITQPPIDFWKKYWPLVGYLLSLCLTATFSNLPSFVFLQILSLVAMLLFGISFFDTQKNQADQRIEFFFRTLVGLYFLVCVASLLLSKLAPALSYEALYAGDAYGYEHRFRGLFSKSAMMGAASGILVGCAWFSVRNWAAKILLLAPGLACLAMTQSRTFLVALLVAGIGTSVATKSLRMRTAVIAGLLSAVIAIVLFSFGALPGQKKISSLLRLETLTTLTGRTDLWTRGVEAVAVRPILGFGFTLGAEALSDPNAVSQISERQKEENTRALARTTLHNGYLQSFLDNGLLGTSFYLSVIVIALKREFRAKEQKSRPAEMFILIFLSIANLGESIIHSASVFHSALFWLVATRALALWRLPSPQRRYFANLMDEPSPRRGVGHDDA